MLFGDASSISSTGTTLMMAGLAMLAAAWVALPTTFVTVGKAFKVAGAIMIAVGALFTMLIGPAVNKKNKDQAVRNPPVYGQPPGYNQPYPGGRPDWDPNVGCRGSPPLPPSAHVDGHGHSAGGTWSGIIIVRRPLHPNVPVQGSVHGAPSGSLGVEAGQQVVPVGKY